MTNSKFRIGISLRVVTAENYAEKRDALSHDWPPFLEKLDMIPIFIPNTLTTVSSFLENIRVDGLLLSGGDNIGENLERDRTEMKTIEYGIEHNVPIFGVCRGMQIINQYFGGSIITTSDSKHIGKPHMIQITSPSFSNTFGTQSIKVNSFHNNIITNEKLGDGLETFAIFKADQSIEGFFHKNHPIVGVMWHPERDPNNNNELIFRKVFHEKDFWNK